MTPDQKIRAKKNANKKYACADTPNKAKRLISSLIAARCFRIVCVLPSVAFQKRHVLLHAI